MTATQILANTFFAFWYILGEHFLGILAMALIFTLLLAWYYLMFKR
jgi:hypothetical protein